MKLLHTSDLHLRKEGDERWEALQKIIEVGKKERIDLLVISGDLFDREIDEEVLRGKVRKVFSQGGFEVVIIPGNHDMECYEEGKYYGENVKVIKNIEESLEYENVRIWGFPFERIKKEGVYKKLYLIGKKITEDSKTNILLFHGELLEPSFQRGEFGEEEEGYMPAELSFFKNLNFKYVLAGHYHTKYSVREIENGRYFVYPGSPVSIKRSERGMRKVNLFEVGAPPREYPLDTFHYEELSITFDPFDDKHPLEIVKENLNKIHPEAKLVSLKIDGYINAKKIGMEENELIRRIKEMVKERCRLGDEELKEILGEPELINIEKKVEDELFKLFIQKMEDKSYDENSKKEIRALVLKAMMMR